MSAVVRLDDYRPKRKPDAMDLMLRQLEFMGLVNVAIIFAGIAVLRIMAEAHRAR